MYFIYAVAASTLWICYEIYDLQFKAQLNWFYVVQMIVSIPTNILIVFSVFSMVILIYTTTKMLKRYTQAYGEAFDLYCYKITLVYEDNLKHSGTHPRKDASTRESDAISCTRYGVMTSFTSGCNLIHLHLSPIVLHFCFIFYANQYNFFFMINSINRFWCVFSILP